MKPPKINKGGVEADPRGLIYEAYRIEDLTPEDCRSIFFDWALGLPPHENMLTRLDELITIYGSKDHPMSAVLNEGRKDISTGKRRRGGRAARLLKSD